MATERSGLYFMLVAPFCEISGSTTGLIWIKAASHLERVSRLAWAARFPRRWGGRRRAPGGWWSPGWPSRRTRRAGRSPRRTRRRWGGRGRWGWWCRRGSVASCGWWRWRPGTARRNTRKSSRYARPIYDQRTIPVGIVTTFKSKAETHTYVLSTFVKLDVLKLFPSYWNCVWLYFLSNKKKTRRESLSLTCVHDEYVSRQQYLLYRLVTVIEAYDTEKDTLPVLLFRINYTLPSLYLQATVAVVSC